MFLFYSCHTKAQLKLESQPKKIAYKTSYKLNVAIEKNLEESDKPWKHQQSFLDYSNKGDYKKALETDAMCFNIEIK